jgi:hydroxysqualene synthase
MSVVTKPERWVLDPPKVSSLENSFRRCRQIARSHYENFPVGSLLIPRRLQPYVFAVYAFARTADDFADEPGYSDAERILYLNEWEELFIKSLDGNLRHPIMWGVVETIRKHDLPVKLFLDLLSAFRQDVSVRRYDSFNDLMDYCRRSADPVGRLLLLIFGYRDVSLFRYSDSVCTALQLANFWQDVSVDLRKNRIYIPREDMMSFGVTESEFFRDRATRSFRELIRYEIERTNALFRMGAPLIRHLRGRFRYEIKCVLAGGTAVLRKIERIDCDVLRTRPKLTVWDAPLLAYNFLVK